MKIPKEVIQELIARYKPQNAMMSESKKAQESKPEPTQKDYEELLRLLETVRGDMKEINKILVEAESRMQIPKEVIQELIAMYK